ncbi:hypothetical protein RHSIM_Rhsim12G0073100 [Rhododendron simsii]|uniref:Uncharacterized protein n=1 Tax=Rhododendron simsii TaxID=118357 RepID=A0A834G658_RHOSS|nr:hypothetical protein RHSIM_Rhsim12G0073100 [Rhododendron simsii]
MEHEWIIEWGDLVDEWLEKEAEELHAQNQPEPGNEIMGALQINDDWLMAYVDHTNHDNEEEWEWIPNEWQILEETDPLDCVTMPLLSHCIGSDSSCYKEKGDTFQPGNRRKVRDLSLWGTVSRLKW